MYVVDAEFASAILSQLKYIEKFFAGKDSIVAEIKKAK